MRKICFAVFMLTMCILPKLSYSMFSLPWIGPLSNRVESMAGAALGIEDNSTELNLLNTGNPAGLAQSTKENRLDLNAGYFYEMRSDSLDEETKESYSFISPGINYNGITYWPLENLVFSIEGQGEKLTYNYPVSNSTDEEFRYSWYSGKLTIAYIINEISIGGEIDYFKLKSSGKPSFIDLEQYELQLEHLGWHVGLGYRKEIIEEQFLNTGLEIGVDNREPDFSSIGSSLFGLWSTNYNTKISYTTSMDLVGIDPGTGLPIILGEADVIQKTQTTRQPFQVEVQAIYDIKKSMQFGIIFNYEIESIYQYNETRFEPEISPPSKSDFKSGEYQGAGITPVVKGQFYLSDNLVLNCGALFSSRGSYSQDSYQSLASENKTNTEISAVNFAAGFGIRTVAENFAIGCQVDQKRLIENNKYYLGGDLIDSDDGDEIIRQQALRFGMEYRPVEFLAVRGGYAYLMDIKSRSSFDSGLKKSHLVTFGTEIDFTTTLSGNIVALVNNSSQNSNDGQEIGSTIARTMLGIVYVF